MPITTVWLDEEKAILCHTFQNTWTWDDLFDSWNTTLEMTHDVGHPVISIVDMRYSTDVPNYAFDTLRRVIGHPRDKHRTFTIIVQAGQKVQRFWMMFGQFYPRASQIATLQFVDTMEEALAQASAYKELIEPGQASAPSA